MNQTLLLFFTAILLVSCASQKPKSDSPMVSKVTCSKEAVPSNQVFKVCQKQKNWQSIKVLATNALQQQELRKVGLYFLSLYHENQKNYPMALWSIEQAITESPSDLFTYQRARILWLNGDQQQSFHHLKELDKKNYAPASEFLAAYSFAKGNCEKTLEYWTKTDRSDNPYTQCLKTNNSVAGVQQ